MASTKTLLNRLVSAEANKNQNKVNKILAKLQDKADSGDILAQQALVEHQGTQETDQTIPLVQEVSSDQSSATEAFTNAGSDSTTATATHAAEVQAVQAASDDDKSVKEEVCEDIKDAIDQAQEAMDDHWAGKGAGWGDYIFGNENGTTEPANYIPGEDNVVDLVIEGAVAALKNAISSSADDLTAGRMGNNSAAEARAQAQEAIAEGDYKMALFLEIVGAVRQGMQPENLYPAVYVWIHAYAGAEHTEYTPVTIAEVVTELYEKWGEPSTWDADGNPVYYTSTDGSVTRTHEEVPEDEAHYIENIICGLDADLRALAEEHGWEQAAGPVWVDPYIGGARESISLSIFDADNYR